MPDPFIDRIFKQRLMDDDETGKFAPFFTDDSWKSQLMSVFYGNDEDSPRLVTRAVTRTMKSYCDETGRVSVDGLKAFLKQKVLPATLIYKKGDPGCVLELLSQAGSMLTRSEMP